MAQFSYDVVPHKGGWAILVTLGEADAFPTKQAAYRRGRRACAQAPLRRLLLPRAWRPSSAGEEDRKRALTPPRAGVQQNRRDNRAGGCYLRVTPQGNPPCPTS